MDIIYRLRTWLYLRDKCRSQMTDKHVGSTQTCARRPGHDGPHNAGDHRGFFFEWWGTDQEIDDPFLSARRDRGR